MTTRKIFKIALGVMLIHYSLSINLDEAESGNLDVKSKFSVNEYERREVVRKQRSIEIQDETEDHERYRRQTGCCVVLPGACNATTRYRTMDGTCNNLANPCWGAADIGFLRLLPPAYQDGISSPRGTEQNLPRVRDVSVGLASVSSSFNDPISLMVMQFGQFLDHDMTSTPETPSVSCCTFPLSSTCFPINVTGDPFYSSVNVKCLPFGRSLPAICHRGNPNQREQVNVIPAYLDCNPVYGNSDSDVNDLRISGSYLMKFGPGRENSACASNDPSLTCRSFLLERSNAFVAGDGRVEEQPGLTSIHTIFIRMHNDLAKLFKDQNPNCDNNTVFQEIRLILGALMQKITFGEFLTFVLGQQTMKDHNLRLSIYTGYDNTVDASLPNSFSAAAYRFGHSLIIGNFTLANAIVELLRNFNNHAATTSPSTFPSEFMKGIAVDIAGQMDHRLDVSVLNFLFTRSPFISGSDLPSRNIQRGRDHGLPSYTSWVQYCSGITIDSFDDLRHHNLMPDEVITKFQQLYINVEDIDLFPAGIAENHFNGGILGDTFKCILRKVFYNLKYGDRFWFQNGIFNSNQLQAIEKTTLSAIICKYAEGASQLPKNIMKTVSSGNPLINCTELLAGTVLLDINLYWTTCPS